MVNERELLINVVMSDKPKLLEGLNQKVSGQVQRFFRFSDEDSSSTGKEATPKLLWYLCGTSDFL